MDELVVFNLTACSLVSDDLLHGFINFVCLPCLSSPTCLMMRSSAKSSACVKLSERLTVL